MIYVTCVALGFNTNAFIHFYIVELTHVKSSTMQAQYCLDAAASCAKVEPVAIKFNFLEIVLYSQTVFAVRVAMLVPLLHFHIKDNNQNQFPCTYRSVRLIIRYYQIGRSFRSSSGEGLRYGWDWICFGQACSMTSSTKWSLNRVLRLFLISKRCLQFDWFIYSFIQSTQCGCSQHLSLMFQLAFKPGYC